MPVIYVKCTKIVLLNASHASNFLIDCSLEAFGFGLDTNEKFWNNGFKCTYDGNTLFRQIDDHTLHFHTLHNVTNANTNFNITFEFSCSSLQVE